MDRLQKILSAAGVCSRRQAEAYLTAGRVAVNGRISSLGDKADPDRDQITVDGAPSENIVLYIVDAIARRTSASELMQQITTVLEAF